MRRNRQIALLFTMMILSLLFISCKSEVSGCMDPDANNYNSEATQPAICTYDPTQVSFYSTGANGPVVVIVEDADTSALLDTYFPNAAPACGQNGTLTIEATPGLHQVHLIFTNSYTNVVYSKEWIENKCTVAKVD